MSIQFSDQSANGVGSVKVFTCNTTSSDLITEGVPGRFKTSPNTMFVAQCTDGTGLFEINDDASAMSLISSVNGSEVTSDNVIDLSVFGYESLTETLDYIDSFLNGGIVTAVIAGNKISVDNSNPSQPIVNFDPSANLGGGNWNN